jgi:hypothetical protein
MSDEKLVRLPMFEQWRARFGGTAGLWDYAGQEGGATLAVAFASLFFPRLIEVGDCVCGILGSGQRGCVRGRDELARRVHGSNMASCSRGPVSDSRRQRHCREGRYSHGPSLTLCTRHA